MWEEFKQGWREAAWLGGLTVRLGGLTVRLIPAGVALALLTAPQCPWPRWVVWAAVVGGLATSAMLVWRHWRSPDNYVLAAFRDEDYGGR